MNVTISPGFTTEYHQSITTGSELWRGHLPNNNPATGRPILPFDAGTVCVAVYRFSSWLFKRRSKKLAVTYLAGRFQAVLELLAPEGRRDLIADGAICQ